MRCRMWRSLVANGAKSTSLISNTWHLFKTNNTPSRKVCGSIVTEWRWLETGLVRPRTDHGSFWIRVFSVLGACPEPTTKALSNEGEKTGLSKPENALVTWVAITGEVNVATGRDEPVMANTEGNVKTTAGNLNVPDKASGEFATSIAWPELTLAISGRKLDIEAAFSQTAEMIAGNEFSSAWSIATAVLLEIDLADIEEATITTTGAADKLEPADKLLKVESGWDMLKAKSHNSQNEEGPLTT